MSVEWRCLQIFQGISKWGALQIGSRTKLQFPTAFHRLKDRYFICVFDVASRRNSRCDPRDMHAWALHQPRNVDGRSLAFHGWIGRENHLVNLAGSILFTRFDVRSCSGPTPCSGEIDPCST